MVAFFGAQPSQTNGAVVNTLGDLAGHIFLHLGFAGRAGHHAGAHNAVPLRVRFSGFYCKRSRGEGYAQGDTAGLL